MKPSTRPAWMELGEAKPVPPPPPPSTKPKVMQAMDKMRDAGFTVGLVDGKVSVEPAGKLTPVQVNWIQANAPKLEMTLKALEIPGVKAMIEKFDAEVMRFERD